MSYTIVLQLSGLVQTSSTNPSGTQIPTTTPGVGVRPFFWDITLWDEQYWDITAAASSNAVTEGQAANFQFSSPYPYKIASFVVS